MPAIVSLLLAWIGSACSGGQATTSDESSGSVNACIAHGRSAPCGLSDPGAGLAFAAAVEFPADDPTAGLVPFRLELRRGEDGLEVGIFSRPKDPDEVGDVNSTRHLGVVGPAELQGVRVVNSQGEHIVAARGLSEAQLLSLGNTYQRNGPDALGKSVALQNPSWVPGTGSLPIPSTQVAYLVSYTSDQIDTGTEEQRSIAVGALDGGQTDVAVLEWWYSNADRTRDGAIHFQSAAYAVPEGEVAPRALLTVAVGADGGMVIFRTAGIDAELHARLFHEVAPVDEPEWLDLLAATRRKDTTSASTQ